jgi:hypothetical protein
MARLPASLRQLCSSFALAGRRERWGVTCDDRVDACCALAQPRFWPDRPAMTMTTFSPHARFVAALIGP